MKKLLCAAAMFAATLTLHAQADRATAAPRMPKLVLAVVVDQFRYDYLNRFRKDYNAGFARILKDGAVFTDAHHIHFPTVTAVGHSTFLSGATPSISGIVANEWYDREAKMIVTSVSDDKVQLLGAMGRRTGSSPNRMLVSTLGDEMKMSGRTNKVIGVSIKDRSAILPAGHMADGAYWFDDASGHFVSSSYYFQTLPDWVTHFNDENRADKFLNTDWLPFDAKTNPGAKPFRHLAAKADKAFYGSLERTPFGNELIEQFAEQAITSEQLGKHPDTDILTVSFSANDYIGHQLGPDSPEVRDVSIQTDRVLGKLLDFVDKQVGAGNYIFVMTADHGVSPVPEVNQARHMVGGRLSDKALFETVQQTLTQAFGDGTWLVGRSGPTMYLNYELIQEKKLDYAAVQRAAAQAVRAMPHVFRVYTREQLLSGQVLEDYVSRAVRNGFYASRSADLFPIPEAFYLYEEHGTSHGTPFNYDTHVPVIFMGMGIHPGFYNETIAVNDIAPTLAALLDAEEPSGSVGRVLSEIFEK